MALDLTTDPQPAFAAVTGAGTTCTEIRGKPFSSVNIYATGAVYLFNGVAEGGAAPAATARAAKTAAQMSSGWPGTFGGPVAGQSYATICIAAQSGTVDITAETVPPERVSP